MLDISDVHFDYCDKPVLASVGFTLDAGALLHLQGDNGAGKTTLLKILAGLLVPTEGRMRYRDICMLSERSHYQSYMAYLGHKSGLSQSLSAYENCRFAGLSQDALTALPALLDLFGVANMMHVPCRILSLGQRKRVGLLRVILSNKPLWLLDEPFNGLDVAGVSMLMSLLHTHLEAGGSVVLTSHQALPFEASLFQTYVL